MREITPDICVIGAGSAGLSLAAGAAQLGAETVLIEAGAMGGECLNSGCVPSKALIAASTEEAIFAAQDGLARSQTMPPTLAIVFVMVSEISSMP